MTDYETDLLELLSKTHETIDDFYEAALTETEELPEVSQGKDTGMHYPCVVFEFDTIPEYQMQVLKIYMVLGMENYLMIFICHFIIV